MRIAVIGGGPGGLYFSYFWKKRHFSAQIDLFEQNPSDAKARLLPYKYLREIRFASELPKTGTGKIDRQAVMRM